MAGPKSMSDLTALLTECSLTHLAPNLGDRSLASMQEMLSAGRPAFLAELKKLGVTALKDRQGLANAISKAGREQLRQKEPKESEPSVKQRRLEPWRGPDADVDLFGRRRGAHRRRG